MNAYYGTFAAATALLLGASFENAYNNEVAASLYAAGFIMLGVWIALEIMK